MVIQENLGILDKLKILSDAAKYDVACTSSGTKRKGSGTGIGNCVEAGICHSFSADGRCISLLKILLTNECVYDCKYCINRCSNDVPRATFTPEEVCQLTIEFYRRNYYRRIIFKLRCTAKSELHDGASLSDTLSASYEVPF